MFVLAEIATGDITTAAVVISMAWAAIQLLDRFYLGPKSKGGNEVKLDPQTKDLFERVRSDILLLLTSHTEVKSQLLSMGRAIEALVAAQTAAASRTVSELELARARHEEVLRSLEHKI